MVDVCTAGLATKASYKEALSRKVVLVRSNRFEVVGEGEKVAVHIYMRQLGITSIKGQGVEGTCKPRICLKIYAAISIMQQKTSVTVNSVCQSVTMSHITSMWSAYSFPLLLVPRGVPLSVLQLSKRV